MRPKNGAFQAKGGQLSSRLVAAGRGDTVSETAAAMAAGGIPAARKVGAT